MSKPLDAHSAAAGAAINDCWNRIGVRGDASCPELERHIHCRNCPVHSAAAATLLDRELPPAELEHRTRQFAQPSGGAQADTHSVMVFRIAAEWLALPTAVFKEIASPRVVHSLPHRRNGVVLGLANIRGELVVCVSLRELLGLQQAAAPRHDSQQRWHERLLVIESEGARVVCPADEVFGIQRFHPRDLMPVPASVAKATATYSRGVLSWRQKTLGLLDEQLLFHTLNRSLASATAI